MNRFRRAVENSSSASMALDIVDRKTDEIEDALDIYDRFVNEELYESEELPSEIEGYLEEVGIDYDNGIDAMRGLATEIAIESNEIDNAFGYIPDEKQKIHLDFQDVNDEINNLRSTYKRARNAGIDEEDPYRRSVEEDIPEQASPGKMMHEIDKDNFEGNLNFGVGLHH